MDIDEIIENFEFLDDWDDRYKYLIELGNALEPFADDSQSAQNKVQGCVSQVWVTSHPEDGEDPVIHYKGTSDAHLVRGLIAIAFAIFSGKKASEIVKLNEREVYAKIDLSDHITPQRSNGLNALVARMKSDAAAAISQH